MKKIKYIKRQDSGFKLSYGNSGETSLNLSNDIFDFISHGDIFSGEEKDITFKIYKEDFVKAMSFVIMKLPLYKSSSNSSSKITNNLDVFDELYSKIEKYFGGNKCTEYKVNLLYRNDGRMYLKGLRVNGFSVRDYLVENHSAIQFDDETNNELSLRILSDVEENGITEHLTDNEVVLPLNQIAPYYRPFISALRTKPFLLLAGISGTGKSRKVQELAYLTCKRDGIHDTDKASPGNYLLIPVKPNWHDSTELLGYYSSITGKYVLTDFIRFLWKAWIHRDVPYFLCLDEMNLAPVEQYFAEYLSILETRKLIYNEDRQKYEIQTAELLSKKLFEGLDTYAEVKIEDNGGDDEVRTKTVPLYKGEDVQIINFLKENGLRLPDNLFVIGTVNMDDTTHQFSRKVIDRAFTIEMNGDELSKMFDVEDTLAYQESPLAIKAIRPRFIKAQEVLESYPQDAETIKAEVPAMLDRINGEGIFKNTPFRVSYRVQNELILYYAAIRPNGELQPEAIKGCLREAFMAVLLEKVLPRVEGDEKAMHCNEKGDSAILQNIRKYLTESFTPEEGTESQLYTTLLDKLDEMNERVKNSYFTSFFS